VRKPFARLFSGLARTRRAITNGIRSALRAGPLMDEGVLEAIEDTLIAADVGVDTAAALVDTLRGAAGGREADERAVLATLAGEVGRVLASADRKARAPKLGEPLVVMVVGVNGVGKTTTIGKLARKYAEEGGKVLMAAADTFRAAAVDQLSVWARRSGSELVGGQSGGDPAAVAHDALDAALARGADVLIVDTAGRLHTRKNLMAELAKIKRVLGRRLEGAPHEVLLVLDANTGQNAVSQARARTRCRKRGCSTRRSE